jgi:hypothetical protein
MVKNSLAKSPFLRSMSLAAAGLFSVLTLAGVSHAQSGSGIQLTPDSQLYLISKDVGAERWAISFNLATRTVTGNVFKTDGSPASFLWCQITGETPAAVPAETSYQLDCFGADLAPTKIGIGSPLV